MAPTYGAAPGGEAHRGIVAAVSAVPPCGIHVRVGAERAILPTLHRPHARRAVASDAARLREPPRHDDSGSMSVPDLDSAPTPRGVLRHYWDVAGIRPWHLVWPVLLIVVAGAFEGASFSLLIPLTDAVSENSFAFLDDSRAFGWIGGLVPESFEGAAARDAFLIVMIVSLIILGRIGKLVFEYVRKLYVVDRNERYRVAVGEETFGRVLSFGRQYFDGQSIGRIDAEIGWSSSVLGLLIAAEELFRYVVGLVVKAGVMVAISLPLSIAFVVLLVGGFFLVKVLL